MAEVKTIKIDVDTKQAVNAMENLSKATNDVNKSFEEVYGDLQPLTTRMGEAEDRLYELANAGQTASQEYQDLLETVGRYRKVQIQTDMAVDAAATTMTQKLGGALGGATAGFELMQGVMGTFGAISRGRKTTP
jgi:methyl-accepting chemotaxis protein